MGGSPPIPRDFHRFYSSRFFRQYARLKLRSDPVYAAVYLRLRESPLPILDIGCGLGLLAFDLVSRGIESPILGIDADSRKVDAARGVAIGRTGQVTFMTGDARSPAEFHGNVVLLDVLHYFEEVEQRELLTRVAGFVPPGGLLIVRECIRDESWRFRITRIEETFARAIGWLAVSKLRFPSLETITGPLGEKGFRCEIEPMWGRTPFNNYLLVFSRPQTS